MSSQELDLFQLDPATRELVLDCEITGRRTVFTRNGSGIAILVSHDEYLALQESIELLGDESTLRDLEEGEDQIKRGAMLLPEDLFGK